jgi:predicted PurR-regulated permease PerM
MEKNQKSEKKMTALHIVLALSTGIIAAIGAFVTRKFLLVFLAAASLCLWFCFMPSRLARRAVRSYRAVAIITGLLISIGG